MSYRDEFFHTVFTTALEGGIGYWAASENYHIWLDKRPGGRLSETKPDLAGFYSDIVPAEDEDDFKPVRIDRAIIAKGYTLATTGAEEGHTKWRDRIRWSSGDKPPMIPNEDWDFDADDADVIVQLGLFGTVVYG